MVLERPDTKVDLSMTTFSLDIGFALVSQPKKPGVLPEATYFTGNYRVPLAAAGAPNVCIIWIIYIYMYIYIYILIMIYIYIYTRKYCTHTYIHTKRERERERESEGEIFLLMFLYLLSPSFKEIYGE